MTQSLLPISTIIPTRNRSGVLKKTLLTIAKQSAQPFEIIIIDASELEESKIICEEISAVLQSKLLYVKAITPGAAAQRNQGIAISGQPFIAFMDDDVYLEANCFSLLWEAINSEPGIGAVNALITNQQFHPLGRISRTVYRLFTSKKILNDLEGRSIGPVLNFLCSEHNVKAKIPVDWLNLGLTIYRKEALPNPVFDFHFKGYSFMEDVALSLTVSRNWKLFTIRDARIFHDSQTGDHKNDVEKLAEMELVNRYYIMTKILYKNSFKNYMELVLFELFYITASGKLFSIPSWKGKIKAIKQIMSGSI